MRHSTSRLLITAAGLALLAVPLAGAPAFAQQGDPTHFQVTVYEQAAGLNAGRRDTAATAQQVTAEQAAAGVELGFRVLSLDAGELTEVVLTPTITGQGTPKLENLVCEVPATSGTDGAGGKIGTLGVHEQATCTAKVTGMTEGPYRLEAVATAQVTAADGTTSEVKRSHTWFGAVTAGSGKATPTPKPTAQSTAQSTTKPTESGKGTSSKGVVAGEELAMVNPALIGAGALAVAGALGGGAFWLGRRKD